MRGRGSDQLEGAAEGAAWSGPADVRALFGSADFLANNRVVFHRCSAFSGGGLTASFGILDGCLGMASPTLRFSGGTYAEDDLEGWRRLTNAG
jgi:hypothetical protein